MYAKEFNLNKHIRYNKEVMSARRADDYEQTGCWVLQVRDHKTGSEETLVFDAVLVCTGHHASKNIPTFPGQDEFQGEILHSHDYKDWTGYTGKRVVVIGIGNSGGDIAVELSRVGQVDVNEYNISSKLTKNVALNGWICIFGSISSIRGGR